MQIARLTILAAVMSIGFSMGAAHASTKATPAPEPVAEFITIDAEASKSRIFDFKGVLHSFSRAEPAETTTLASKETHPEECPEEKQKSKATETKKSKEGSEQQPQGPEPIYFAF